MTKTSPRPSSPTPCNDTEFLQRFLREQLDEAEEARVQEHVSVCRDCQRALESAAGDASLWRHVSENLGDADPADDAAPDVQLDEVVALLAPSDDPAMMGRLGSYEVRGLVGIGSTGVVLKALDPRLGRTVAIKLMAPVYRSSGAARRRFEREGRAIAAVSNDHVVPVYSVDEFRGLPYIVMKYVPGVSLEQRIERDGPLDSRAAARVGLQVASALAAAHAQGIVHRDVKPANVLLEETVDRVMVTDFGLARVADEVSMTHSGTITGTPQYMAPEQARGDTVDARADLFSLGSLLYATCTGRPPFRAETLFGVIHRVCHSDPRPIREIHPEIDETLAALVGKLMSKHADDRFQSAREVEAALASELAHLQNPAGTPRPQRDWLGGPVATVRRRPRIVRAVAVCLGAGALVAGAWIALCGERTDEPGSSRAAVAPGALAGVQDPIGRGLENARVTWAQDGGEFVQTVEKSFSVPPEGELKVRVDTGDVVVEPTDRSEVAVTVQSRIAAGDRDAAVRIAGRRELGVAHDGAVVALTSTTGDDVSGSDDTGELRHVLYRIAVPRGCRSDVATAAGRISIGELVGDVTAAATGGGVELARVDGSVDVRSTGGDIDLSSGCTGEADLFAVLGGVRVGNIVSSARVRTSGGDVRLDGSAGTVYAQTSGGSIFVTEIDGPTGAFASGGNVVVEVPRAPAANARLNANDGRVTVRVASGVAADIEARGDVDTTFPVTVRDAEDGTGEPWSVTRLNGGGARIRATCPSGSVTIRELASTSSGPDERQDPTASAARPHGGKDTGVGDGGVRGGGIDGGVRGGGVDGGVRGGGVDGGVRGGGVDGGVRGGGIDGGVRGGGVDGGVRGGGVDGGVRGGGVDGGVRGGGVDGGVRGGGVDGGVRGGGVDGGVRGGGVDGGVRGGGVDGGVRGGGIDGGVRGGGIDGGVRGGGVDGGVRGGGVDGGVRGGGVAGSGLEGSGLEGSGLGGSGLRGSGSGGSGGGRPDPRVSAAARARTAGDPRPGALATVELPEPRGAMDGYTLYLPISHATHDGEYPVLVYLQGAYGVGGAIGDLNNWGLLRLLRDETDATTARNRLLLDGFIVVSPHIQRGRYHDHPEVVRDILENVFAHYKADRSRVYLTGLSRGGHGTWGLAASMPGTFAAIAPIGGSADGVEDWAALAEPAIWISHNRGDTIVSFDGAESAIRQVESRFGVEFRRFDRLDVDGADVLEHRHVLTSARSDSHDAWTDVYSGAAFYQWLLHQRTAGAAASAGR